MIDGPKKMPPLPSPADLLYFVIVIRQFLTISHLDNFFASLTASQYALEVMLVSEWVSVSTDLTDVTLVSEDACGDDEDDES